MLISKKNRHAIYESLFKEGVMVAKKDYHPNSKHPDLENIPNLEVIKTMTSLKSREYVNEQFAWRHFYWYLTNDGINYLRKFLHLPPEIVPATLKRPNRTETPKARSLPIHKDTTFADEDRSSYRRPPLQPMDKKADVGAGTSEVVFKGYGRGRGGASPQ